LVEVKGSRSSCQTNQKKGTRLNSDKRKEIFRKTWGGKITFGEKGKGPGERNRRSKKNREAKGKAYRLHGFEPDCGMGVRGQGIGESINRQEKSGE